MKFETITYLKNGNDKQQKVYALLTSHQLLEKLRPFDPLVVGTIPINIDIANSDIDIICFFSDQQDFIKTVTSHFKDEKGFIVTEKRENTTVIANFWMDTFEIEIFGQTIPTRQQFAYRHLLIEHALLQERGEAFRQQIIALKQQGYKTEPAFAIALGLTGDPYTELLNFEK